MSFKKPPRKMFTIRKNRRSGKWEFFCVKHWNTGESVSQEAALRGVKSHWAALHRGVS